jgi:phosphoserine phosphatase RsbU/P
VVRWREGDRLVFFTDGVSDARDQQGRRLGEQAVLDLLASTPATATPDELLEAVFAQVQQHVGRAPLRDDWTVVVVDRP